MSMSKQAKTYLKLFIAGSAFPVVIWPFLYLGIASYNNPAAAFQFDLVPAVLPFLFGFTNMLRHAIRDYIFPKNLTLHYWTVGALYGLGLSLYGNFRKDIPVDLFGLPDTSIQYIIIPIAMLLYALVWRFIVKNINQLFSIE